ncbi:lachesin-like [Aphidius gifuensis]|uniref:lachesin-like n=1 Tax=Aphidius gifuensis TaxID=684658 RepID=UPI001CDBB5C6|nr:lachesin-like [Aphidius gifuensis]
MDVGGMKGSGSETGSSPVNRTIKKKILQIFYVIIIGLIDHAIGYGSSKSYLHQEIYGSGPSFVQPVGNQTAAIGREAVFSCYVRNIGKYKVGWLKTSDQTVLSLNTKIVTHNTRIAVSYETGGCSSLPSIPMGIHSVTGNNQVTDEGVNCTWRLHIRHLKESDRGCYMCQINTSPMKSELGCLDILVPPDIVYGEETSKDLSVSEGENVTLNCQATGKPTPRVSWRREDGHHILIRNSTSFSNRKNIHFQTVEVYNDTKLQFYRVDRQQMGVYMCIATNDVPPSVSKRVTLEVNFAPVVEAPTQLLGGPVGKRITLECTVEAHPNTINYWQLNETGMLLDGPKYEIRETRIGYKIKMTLVIKKFTQYDPGNYKCIATNSLGKGESSIRLYDLKLQDDISIIGGLAEAARGSSNATNFHPNSLIYITLGALQLLVRVACSR